MSIFMTANATATETMTVTESSNELTVTTNGDVAYTAKGVNSNLVALFFKLVRGLTSENLEKLLQPCISDIKKEPAGPCADAMLLDLFLLMINTRGVRHGKGEKALFFEMFFTIGKDFPNQCIDLLRDGIIQDAGSFKDLKVLYSEAGRRLQQFQTNPPVFAQASSALQQNHVFLKVVAAECVRIFCDQVSADLRVLDKFEEENIEEGKNPSISLAAKWAPRENKKLWRHMAKVIALKVELQSQGHEDTQMNMSPQEQARALKKYRKTIARLNKSLNTCEIKMCDRQWSRINPGFVPSQCLKRKRDAFLNLDKKERGKQRSADSDRIKCAENFAKHLEKGKSVHGRAVHVNEIVGEYMNPRHEQSPADPVLEAQWRDIRESFDGLDNGLSKYVAMADVSGSMYSCCGSRRGGMSPTSPIVCSIALSILISEVSHPAFRDRVLTFDSNPTWCNLVNGSSLAEKINVLQKAAWGMSTDFYLAMEKIVQSCVEANLTETEIPKGLVVFSDMQFNSSGDTSSNCMDRIKRLWQENGYASAPKIIFWNLNGNTTSFPTHANEQNVKMISGFSQNLMKSFMEGSDYDKETPESTLRDILSEEWLDGLRGKFKPHSRTLEEPAVIDYCNSIQHVESVVNAK